MGFGRKTWLSSNQYMIISILLIISIVCLTMTSGVYKVRERFDGTQQRILINWKDLGLQASKVVIRDDGSKLALAFDDTLMAFNDATNKWSAIGGCFSKVASKNRQEIIGLTRTFHLYQTENGDSSEPEWAKLSNSRFTNVSVAQDGTIWVSALPIVDNTSSSNWELFSYDAASGIWTRLPCTMKQVAVQSASVGWGVAFDDTVWKWSAGSWSIVPGMLKQISVGSDGDVWGVDRIGDLLHRNADGTWGKVDGSYKYVDVKDSKTLLVIDSENNVLFGSPSILPDLSNPLELPQTNVLPDYLKAYKAYIDALLSSDKCQKRQ